MTKMIWKEIYQTSLILWYSKAICCRNYTFHFFNLNRYFLQLCYVFKSYQLYIFISVRTLQNKSVSLYLQHICESSIPALWTPEPTPLLSARPPPHNPDRQSLLSGNGTHSSNFSLCVALFFSQLLQATSGSMLGNEWEYASKTERKQKVKHILMRIALLTSEATPTAAQYAGRQTCRTDHWKGFVM